MRAAPAHKCDPGVVPGGKRPFYGWAIVAAMFLMLATSSGLGFYALSLYLETLTGDRGFSVSSVSGATALFFVVGGVAGVYVGRLLARRDPRPVIVAAAGVCAVAVLLLGRATELWQVYAVYAIFGVGFAGTALVPATTLVTRWFHRRRAVALSVASTGLSIGGIVFTPLASALIDAKGLRGASPWLAAGFLIGVVPATVLLVRPDPASAGLQPDGDDAPPRGTAPLERSGVAYATAIRTRTFRAITLTWTLCLLSQVGGIAHLYKVTDDRTTRTTAALVVSVMAGFSVIGRLFGGWLLTRVRLRPFALFFVSVQAVGLLLLSSVGTRAGLLLAAAVFGASVGNVLLLHPVVLAEVFGVADYPRVFATSQLVTTAGVAAGPFLLGVVHDWAGNYRAAYVVAAALAACGAITLATGGPLVEMPVDSLSGEASPEAAAPTAPTSTARPAFPAG